MSQTYTMKREYANSKMRAVLTCSEGGPTISSSWWGIDDGSAEAEADALLRQSIASKEEEAEEVEEAPEPKKITSSWTLTTDDLVEALDGDCAHIVPIYGDRERGLAWTESDPSGKAPFVVLLGTHGDGPASHLVRLTPDEARALALELTLLAFEIDGGGS